MISGIGQSEIGRRLYRSPVDLALEACLEAMRDAGLTPAEIDGLATYPGRLEMPPGVSVPRAQDRDKLRREFDRLRHDLDTSRTMERMDQYDRQALEMVLSNTRYRRVP